MEHYLLSPENLLYLLRFDSVYGRYDKPVHLGDGTNDGPSIGVSRVMGCLLIRL